MERHVSRGTVKTTYGDGNPNRKALALKVRGLYYGLETHSHKKNVFA
jgi:hypothetical protein